ncbi:MAG: hypothetical protein ABSD50_09695 [Smithella sp.]|jgi:hypothetical protein
MSEKNSTAEEQRREFALKVFKDFPYKVSVPMQESKLRFYGLVTIESLMI